MNDLGILMAPKVVLVVFVFKVQSTANVLCDPGYSHLRDLHLIDELEILSRLKCALHLILYLQSNQDKTRVKDDS